MEIRHFQTFKAIVELGSFTKASQALNYAQSSITSHIQALEEYYGQPVFDRIGKRVVLNSFGTQVYQQTLVLLASYDDICNLKKDQDGPSGTLRIGAPESTMLYRLSPILQKYKARYPRVEIIMHNAQCPAMRKALREGELDLGILLDRVLEEPDLVVQPLFEEPMSVVMPARYPADDLVVSSTYAMLFTEQGCSYRTIFQALLTKKGIYPENILETASVEVIKQYILCDLGVSFLPTVVVAKELQQGVLKHRAWQTDDPIMLQIAHHRDKWMSPAMEAFIRIAVEESSGWHTHVR